MMPYWAPNILSWSNYFAGSLSLIYGTMWLLFYSRISKFFAIETGKVRGALELRSFLGGFIVWVSFYSLMAGDVLLFRMLGFGWLGVALVRLFFTLFGSRRFYFEDFLYVFLQIAIAWFLIFT